MDDFWTGALVGASVGLLVGLLWEEAFELIREAIMEKRGERKNGDSHRTWFGRVSDFIDRIGLAGVLVAMSVILITMGSLMIIQYAKLTTFIECQARYNQSDAETRDRRVDESNSVNTQLFSWIATIQPLIKEEGKGKDAADLANFQQELADLLQQRKDYVRLQKSTPYQTPTDVCGETD